ncbi:MAG: hypothetical protein IPJ01_10900 [Micavibrio sp.]|nr:hypothetical protein [Micavibrio sp.]
MKKDDFVTKDIEADIVALGYDGVLPVEVRLVSEWLESKFPNSILREGYHLWREDLYQNAYMKYPFHDFYERRNCIVRLAIDGILKNIPEGNKVENNDIKNTLDVIENFEKAENSKQNTKDVLDADLKALKIYLGLGYSVEDAKNAFYKVFGDKSEANKKRFERLSKYITDYDKKK